MLGFFRRYQKPFFIVISVVIIFTFIFFGAFTAFQSTSREANKTIKRLADGAALKEKDLYAMVRFLSHSPEEEKYYPNVLSDSFLSKDIVLSGIGQEIATYFFKELEPELSQIWKRMKNYVPYSHPFDISINAKQVWAQFYPELNELFAKLKQAPEEFSQNELPLFFAFYEAQSRFPASLLAQILYYKEQEKEGIRKDPLLTSLSTRGEDGQFSLFGFSSFQDWFGSLFQVKVAEVIFEVAAYAKKETHRIEIEEAKADLFSRAMQTLSLSFIQARQEPLTHSQFSSYCQRIFHNLGLTENKAVFLWQQLLLFRSVCQEVGQTLFIDKNIFEPFQSKEKISYQVKTYQLPPELHFSHFEEMLLFERYIEAIYNKERRALLPIEMKSLEEIEQYYPELLYKTFNIEMAKASKEQIAQSISIKTTWDWESKIENRKSLKEAFPSLFPMETASFDEWMDALEKTKPRERLKIDQFAREKILEKEPHRIVAYLSKIPKEKTTLQVSLSLKKKERDGRAFLDLLENKDKELDCYTVDQKTYYAFSHPEEIGELRPFSFSEAKEKGVIQEMLEEHLERAAASFGFKGPLTKVKEQVALKLYANLVQEIETKAQKKLTLSELALHRFDGALEEMRKAMIAGEAMNTVWPLSEKEEQRFIVSEDLSEKQFSPVENGQFYQLIKKEENSRSFKTEVQKKIEQVKAAIEREAVLSFIKVILETSWKEI